MDKLELLKDSSDQPYYPDNKCNFSDFIVVQDYLVMILVTNQVDIFKLNTEAKTAHIYKTIDLTKKLIIKSIEAINPNNVFLIYNTDEVQVIDIITGKQQEVTLINSATSVNLKTSVVSIHEQIKLHKSQLYLGFIAFNERLYLAHKTSDSNKYSFNCIEIQSFNQKIIHVEYKLFEAKDQTYCFICVLCQQQGYCYLIEMKKDKNVSTFVSLLQTKWMKIFREDTIIDYSYSFYYNPSNYSLNCFVILTGNNKMMCWTWNAHFNSIQTLLVERKKTTLKIPNNINTRSICNYSTVVYIYESKSLFQVKYSSSIEQSTLVKFKSAINKIKLFNVKNKYYMFGMAVKEMVLRYVHTEQNEHKQFSDLTLGGDKKKNLSDSKTNDEDDENKTNQSNIIPTEKPTVVKCNSCDDSAAFRCDHCQNFFACTDYKHPKQFEDHIKVCEKYKTKEVAVVKYVSLWDDQRKVIVDLMSKNEHGEAITKAYAMVHQNIKKIKELRDKKHLYPFEHHEGTKKEGDDIIHSYLYYEDYFCNILLLIHAFSRFQSKDDVWRLLNRLVREMEGYHINVAIDEICGYFRDKLLDKEKVATADDKKTPNVIEKEKQQDPKKAEIKEFTSKDLENIFLRILKLIISISKFAYTLGEFTLYEEYLLMYVQKIDKVYSKDEYIKYNTYLLLGNLFVEFGSLKKGSTLYDAIISNNNLNIQAHLRDCVLCANYNSGLIHFVRDNYEMAKQRLNGALKIKKEQMKERNDLQISIIYETLAETYIEYKQFADASHNLQNAIESRELSNTVTPDFTLKAQVLRDYIIQNAADTKTNLNPNLQLNIGKSQDNDSENLLQNFLSDCPISLDKNPEINELEKFFLFMTKLSEEQIIKLNNGQPHDCENNKFFPIVFSRDFKKSLNHNQRLAAADLKITSLTRVNVLKQYKEKILINNLNYNALNLVPPENNLNSIRNLYVTKKIMKNWEATEDVISESDEDSDRQDEKSDRKGKRGSQYLTRNKALQNDKRKDLVSFSSQEEDTKYKNLSVNFSLLKEVINNRCKSIGIGGIDDKFLFDFCRETDSNELKEILKSPEMIDLVIETYHDTNIETLNQDGRVQNEKGKDYDEVDPDKIDQIETQALLKEFLKEDEEKEFKQSNIPPPPDINNYIILDSKKK